ncbi:AAA family ATPase [Nitratireductor indicus]|uniref:AAA family ATPase n=1 Tax=Nitratireductor indicus TaxID=721133 RepID=UPI0028763D5C|nr:AAA family ATPase [Nitratireductor indicus]MDS1138189.1 AAA family ATPase [Nitratireductor indicus]
MRGFAVRLLNTHITRFRRFADLTIQDIPASAKLVVLAGPNGSGKSSLFDALLLRYRIDTGYGWNGDTKYYDRPQDPIVDLGARISVTTEASKSFARGNLYVRTAYRNDHEFTTDTLRRQGPILDNISLNRLIEPDATVSVNYQRLASQAMEDVFVNEAAGTTMGDYRKKLIGEVRSPLKRLFPDLTFVGVGNPLDQGTFQFDKGTSKGFDYKNLSGGEKASFDLILDFVVKRRSYADAIYCIDEPETHMNTRLQAALLGELVGLLPGNSQLLIASHSIGMMRKAREMYDADPTSVAFIDFSGHDFDQVITLSPSRPTRAFWEGVMHVALDDLAALVAPKQVVICEGNPLGSVQGKNAEHDAQVYEAIFADEMPDTTFISAGNSKEVQNDFIGLATVLPKLTSGMKIIRLIDLDDHTPTDVAAFKSKGVNVLSLRHIEAYLYDDEVLTALCDSVGKPEKTADLIAAKSAASASVVSQGHPADDIKKAAGTIYVAAKKILSLTQVGNDASAFARNTLSKLIKPGMTIYDKLRIDVFGV